MPCAQPPPQRSVLTLCLGFSGFATPSSQFRETPNSPALSSDRTRTKLSAPVSPWTSARQPQLPACWRLLPRALLTWQQRPGSPCVPALCAPARAPPTSVGWLARAPSPTPFLPGGCDQLWPRHPVGDNHTFREARSSLPSWSLGVPCGALFPSLQLVLLSLRNNPLHLTQLLRSFCLLVGYRQCLRLYVDLEPGFIAEFIISCNSLLILSSVKYRWFYGLGQCQF